MSPGLADRLPGRLAALVDGDGLPEPDGLPRYVAPLPRAIENLALNLVWVIVAVNLVGTAFGFWYYGPQLSAEPVVAWPIVPDSPTATLFVALALAAWKLGRPSDYLSTLAFFGCWKLGLWTPYVLAAFAEGFLANTAPPMYAFLFVSHLGMAAEAFVLHRIGAFRTRAVAVAVAWYGGNDVIDYFVGVVGTPHHTLLPGQTVAPGGAGFTHPDPIHSVAAAGAVVLTLSATYLTLATRVESLRSRRGGDD